jgi:hypothetical protein
MGRTESPDPNIDYERALVGTALFIESEMALLFEYMLSCARKLLDTADIIRDAMSRQQSYPATPCKENRLRRIWMI